MMEQKVVLDENSHPSSSPLRMFLVYFKSLFRFVGNSLALSPQTHSIFSHINNANLFYI